MFLPCRCRRRRRRMCSWLRQRRQGACPPRSGHRSIRLETGGAEARSPRIARGRTHYMLCRTCVFATKHSSRARAAQVFFPPQGKRPKARAKRRFAGDCTNDHPYLHRLSTASSTARGDANRRPTNGAASLQFCDTAHRTRGSSNSASPAIATMRSSGDGVMSAMPVKRPNAGRIAWLGPRTKHGRRSDSPPASMRIAGCR